MIVATRSALVIEESVAVVDQPWTRVKNPPPIPQDVRAAALRQLDEDELAQLIRAYLLPPGGRDDGERRRWRSMWLELAADDQLRHWAFDVLEDFMDRTEGVLETENLEEATQRRARSFLHRCEEAWERLQGSPRQGPLEWAGPSAGRFNPPARTVMGKLVGAIAAHRAAVHRDREPGDEDERLWGVLRQVGLDPQDYPDARRPR